MAGLRISSSESGASLVLIAVSMTLLLGVAAIAVDLAILRQDIRADRLATDAAVTAGVAQISPFAGTGAVEACETAWEYVLLNLEDETAVSSPDCSARFAADCDPDVAREETILIPPYTVTIVQPVTDGHTLMGSQTPDQQIDGEPCQRFGVAIERDRDYFFAPIIGATNSRTRVGSVARISTQPGEAEVVPLLLLEPIACPAVYTSGQAKITVSYNDTTGTPGIIVVDSDASDCGASDPYSIDAQGNQKGWIRAIPVPGENLPSAILSYALSDIGTSDPTASYDPNDLTDPVDPADITNPNEPLESRYRLYPRPTQVLERITRAPIDWRYNCHQDGYPDYPLDLSNPGLGAIPVPECPFAEARYMDAHIASYGGAGAPPGFNTWTVDGPYPCSVGSGPLSVSGDWYVDCPGGLIVNGTSVTFDGNVVFDGGIDLRSGANLYVNTPNTSDVFMYVRDGGIIRRASASFILDRTFVYLANGNLDLRAGSPTESCAASPPTGICWTAPEGGNFEDLALWSEAWLPHKIGGQSGNNLTGTFFTPFAEPFELDGQGNQIQFEAQFVTRRLFGSGQGVVEMTPDPEKTTPIPVRAVQLIR